MTYPKYQLMGFPFSRFSLLYNYYFGHALSWSSCPCLSCHSLLVLLSFSPPLPGPLYWPGCSFYSTGPHNNVGKEASPLWFETFLWISLRMPQSEILVATTLTFLHSLCFCGKLRMAPFPQSPSSLNSILESIRILSPSCGLHYMTLSPFLELRDSLQPPCLIANILISVQLSQLPEMAHLIFKFSHTLPSYTTTQTNESKSLLSLRFFYFPQKCFTSIIYLLSTLRKSFKTTV